MNNEGVIELSILNEQLQRETEAHKHIQANLQQLYESQRKIRQELEGVYERWEELESIRETNP